LSILLACIANRAGRRLVVPSSVLPEVDYLITKRYGPHIAIAAVSAVTSGDFELEMVTSDDFPRILALMRQYADASIGFMDASVVAVAERLGIRSVLTLDRR
jgi:predicted nucleic acid-binding protein